MTDGERLANLRAAVASASARLERLLDNSKTSGALTMSAGVEDEIALVHACLERALSDDEKNAG